MFALVRAQQFSFLFFSSALIICVCIIYAGKFSNLLRSTYSTHSICFQFYLGDVVTIFLRNLCLHHATLKNEVCSEQNSAGGK